MKRLSSLLLLRLVVTSKEQQNWQEIEAQIRERLVNPAEGFEDEVAASFVSNETMAKFEQLAFSHNSPRVVYSSNSGEEFTRNTRGIGQFGPVEVDSYKFTQCQGKKRPFYRNNQLQIGCYNFGALYF